MSSLDPIKDAAIAAGVEWRHPRDGVFVVSVRPWLHVELWAPGVPGRDAVGPGLDALIALLERAREAYGAGGPARLPPTPAPPRRRKTRRWP